VTNEKNTTLYEDMILLQDDPTKPKLSFERRMAIMYRVDRKKIIESQLHIVNYVQNILEKIEGIFTA
jgi:hypothetical protein